MKDAQTLLYNQMLQVFNEDDLKELTLLLNIHYEDLNGTNRRTKIISLINYCKRTNQLPELVELCQNKRPSVSWPSISEFKLDQDEFKPVLASPPSSVPKWVWGGAGFILLALIVVAIWRPWDNVGEISEPETAPIEVDVSTTLEPIIETVAEPVELTEDPIDKTGDNVQDGEIKEVAELASEEFVEEQPSLFPNLVPISIENADQVTQIGDPLGKGSAWGDIAFSRDDTLLGVATTIGVYLYDSQKVQSPEQSQFTTPNQFLSTNHPVEYLVFSPVEDILAYVDTERNLYLWDYETQEQLEVPEDLNDLLVQSIYALSFAPDGKLAIGTWNEAYIWQPKRDDSIITVPVENWVFGVAFSHNNKLMATVNGDGFVNLFNVARCFEDPEQSCEELLSYDLEDADAKEIAISDMGLMVASGTDETVEVWDVSECYDVMEETCVNHLTTLVDEEASMKNILDLAFLPGSNDLITGSGDASIRIWQPDESDLTSWSFDKLGSQSTTVNNLGLSNNGDLLAARIFTHSIGFWKLSDLSKLTTFYDHIHYSNPALLSNSNRVLLGSWDYIMRLLSLEDGSVETFKSPGHVNQIEAEVGLKGEWWAAKCGCRTTPYLWPGDLREEPNHLEPHGKDPSAMSSMTFSPDGSKIVIGTDEGSWHLWNDFDDKADPLINSEPSSITATMTSLSFVPDSNLLFSGHEDGTILLWDSGNGNLISDGIESPHITLIRSSAVSPNGQWLAIGGDDGNISLWRIEGETISQVEILSQHSDSIRDLVFSPDNLILASASSDKQIRLWDVEQQRVIEVLSGHTSRVDGVDYSQDGRFLVSTGNDGTVRIWGVASEAVE